MVESNSIQNLQDIANVLRVHSLKMTNASKSGHPTSCASIAEIIAVLFFDESGMHFYPTDPRNPANDRFVLSKGHASPIYYAAWAEAGNFPKEDLLNLRKVTSDLEGHPTPRLSFCDFATGSLGQGLANTAGCAYSSKYFDKNPNKHFCIIGDGESMEGSVWEAISFAGLYQLDNLIAIFDVNRLGQSDHTAFEHHTELFKQRLESFGFKALIIDGHDISQVIAAFNEARNTVDKPTAIIAKTFKGKGFTTKVEDKLNFHGKPITDLSIIEDIEKHIVNKTPVFKVTHPTNTFKFTNKAYEKKYELLLNYKINEIQSTRQAFGNALKKLGDIDGKDNNIVIGIDGDVKNSTFSDGLFNAYPDKFINCFIAEQLMVGVGQGACKTNKIPFLATFSTFYTRAFDQIRMGAISQDNVKYVGTHSGVHIGEDGPSQMGLEDIALFRAVPGMTVLVPSDGVSGEKSVEIAANHIGSVFIRTERNTHPVIYSNEEKFEIGKCKVIKKSDSDKITIVSFGATLYESLEAAKLLEQEGIHCRIIDIFSIKPIDKQGLIDNISQTNNLAYVIEDHYYEGALGEAVMSALSCTGAKIHHKAVDKVPRSGKPQELYEMYGLDSKSIYGDIKKILS